MPTGRTVEVHATLSCAGDPGTDTAWLASTTDPAQAGLFGFGRTPARCAETLGAQVFLAVNRPARADTATRAVRVWVSSSVTVEPADPQRLVTASAVCVQTPAGEWVALLRPTTDPPLDLCGYGATRLDALNALAGALAADQDRAEGATVDQTAVRLLCEVPVTGKIRHVGDLAS